MGYRVDASQMTMWVPAPAVMLVQISGHGEGAFVEPVISAIDVATAARLRPQLFFEIMSMPRYDSSFRTRFTSYFARAKRDVATLAVLTDSKFALMGATVANLALGGLISVFSVQVEFDRAVDAALHQAGVRGLSSAVFWPTRETGATRR
jgi:hypothetical protein